MSGAILYAVVVCAAKATLILGAALVAARLAPRPAMRHAILAWGVIGALALPLLGATLPGVTLRVPRLAPAAVPPQPAHAGAVTAGEPSADPLAGTQAGAARRGWPRPGPGALVAAWLAGALLLAARTARAHASAWKAVRRGTVVGPSAIRVEFERMRPVKARVALVESPEVNSPAVYGVFRPAIVLPAGPERYGPVEARAILAHELAHVRRGDCLTALLGELSRAVYWFNPLVHLALRRMGEECEVACDDVVLAAGTPPTAYATILLEAVRQASRIRPSAALVSMAQSSGLERRVRRILAASAGRRFARRMPRLRALSYVVAAALLATVAGAQVGSGPAPLPPEPGLAGDLLARPESERLADVPPGAAASRTLLAGPDSALARMLADAAARPSRHETDLVPERARWALAQADGGRLVEPLIAHMASPDWRVRAYAAWALGRAGDPRAVPALLAAADDPNWRLRAIAGTALSRLGDPRAFAAMARALRDPAWQVRVGAVEYMGHWGGGEGRKLVRPFLNDRHVAVRHAASSFLATKR